MELTLLFLAFVQFVISGDPPTETWPKDFYANIGTIGHVIEPRGKHVGTLIFFHGFKQTAENWIQTMTEVQEEVPGLRIVLPTAEPRRIMATGQPGKLPRNENAWFDLIDRFGYYGLPDDREDATGIRMARAWIRDIIRDEISKTKTPSNKIVLGGWDMGAAISVFTGLTFENTLAGVAAHTGWIPLQSRLKVERTKENDLLPFLLTHGEDDIVVPYTHAFPHSEKFLKSFGQPYTKSTYEYIPHYWTQGMQDDLVDFVKKVLKTKGKVEKKPSPPSQHVDL